MSTFDSPDTTASSPAKGAIWSWMAIALAVPLVYALYTQQIWEDYLITFRHSKNLVEGRGLVYNPPERVQGFTSPLGVLLPAAFYAITGTDQASLWLFRLASAGGFALGGLFFLKAAGLNSGGRRLAVILFAALYLADVKAVMYSADGMETGFMLLFEALLFWLLLRGAKGAYLGLACAGLMWTRPDGCIYIVAFVLAGMLFLPTQVRPRLRTFAAALGVCLVFYGPWVAWAWWYYHSPIPHTVVAKSNVEEGIKWQLTNWLSRLAWRWPGAAAQVFQPVYYSDGKGWMDGEIVRYAIESYSYGLGLVSGLYWLVARDDIAGRVASFAFAILTLYLSFLASVFPWYLPPVSVLGWFVLARLLCRLPVLAKGVFPPGGVARISWIAGGLGIIVLVAQLTLFGLISWQMKIQQRVIEDGHRAEIGRWLKNRVGPHERVFLEPIGYIGYFSGAHIVDYPGLLSPEVVRLRRQHRLAELRVEWLIFRRRELAVLLDPAAADKFRREYREEHVSDVTPILASYRFLPGRAWLEFDACYHVFKRIGP